MTLTTDDNGVVDQPFGADIYDLDLVVTTTTTTQTVCQHDDGMRRGD